MSQPEMEFLVTERVSEILEFIDGVEIPGIRFGIHNHAYFCWVTPSLRCEPNLTGYGLTQMHFEPNIIRSLMMAGSHIPMGFDYAGKVVLLAIEPPCPSNKVKWNYVSCDLPTGMRDLSKWLDECGPLAKGIRGIVDFDTLHLWVPVPNDKLPIAMTHKVKQFECENFKSASTQVSQLLADGNVFLDFGFFDSKLVATYIEITPEMMEAPTPSPAAEPPATNIPSMPPIAQRVSEPEAPLPTPVAPPPQAVSQRPKSAPLVPAATRSVPVPQPPERPRTPPQPKKSPIPVWSNGTNIDIDQDLAPPKAAAAIPVPPKTAPEVAARCKSPSRMPGMSGLSPAFFDEPHIPIDPTINLDADTGYRPPKSSRPNKSVRPYKSSYNGTKAQPPIEVLRSKSPLQDQMSDEDVEDELFGKVSEEFEKYRLKPTKPTKAAPRKNKSVPGHKAANKSSPDEEWEEEPQGPPPKPKTYFKAMAGIKVPKSDLSRLHQLDVELHEEAKLPGPAGGGVFGDWMRQWSARGKPDGPQRLDNAMAAHDEIWEKAKKPTQDSWDLPHIMATYQAARTDLQRNMMADEIQTEVDKDGDCMLNPEEFNKMYEEMFGGPLTQQQLEATFRQVDIDGSGECNFRELMQYLDKAAAEHKPNPLAW
jgi:hypothetical protein